MCGCVDAWMRGYSYCSPLFSVRFLPFVFGALRLFGFFHLFIKGVVSWCYMHVRCYGILRCTFTKLTNDKM